jgi:hypothetical protein
VGSRPGAGGFLLGDDVDEQVSDREETHGGQSARC